jgi:hypothetical protein
MKSGSKRRNELRERSVITFPRGFEEGAAGWTTTREFEKVSRS